MANVPYKAYPTNEPAAAPPHDYFRLDVRPGAFGGHVAKGLEQFGEGVQKADEIWGQIQTDNQINNALKEGDQVIEEFKSKRGQDALDAQDGVRRRLDEIKDKYGSQLPPYLKHRFDQAYRPYQDRYWNGQITTHSIAQGYSFAKSTNSASEQIALTRAANNFNNPEEVEIARHQVRDAQIKQLQIDGMAGDPNAVAEALRRADTATYKAAAEAMYQHNPIAAADYVEKHREELGQAYAPLAAQFRERAARIEDRGTADTIRNDIRNGRAPVIPETYPTAVRPSNVVPLPSARPDMAPSSPSNTAPVASPDPPPMRLPNESYRDYKKRTSSQAAPKAEGEPATDNTAMQFSGEPGEPHDRDIASFKRMLESRNRTPAHEQVDRERALSSPGRVIETQNTGGHVRDLPIKQELKGQLDAAAQATNTKVIVFSGGQPASGRERTGSHRHDNGGAADIELRDAATGRLLDMSNPRDAERMALFVTTAVRNGATGVGAGKGYMGPHRLHVGGGAPAAWGDADWIKHAWVAGQGTQAQR